MSEQMNSKPDKRLAASPVRHMNPVLVMISIVVIAVVMTWFIDSGKYQRQGRLVIPNTYQVIEKNNNLGQLIGATPAAEHKASAVSLPQAFMAIPLGIAKQSGLIFMVLFIGGMFGVLNQTGAIDTGLERVLGITNGNIYLLVPVLMLIFSAGSTFMGLAKEYLLVIPMVVALVNRLGLSNLTGLGIVAIAVKVGYLASVTNPYALSVAQPLLGLPVFSGISLRIAIYVIFLIIGIAFMLLMIRRQPLSNLQVASVTTEKKLTPRHTLLLLTLLVGIVFLVYGSSQWHWKSPALSAYYLFLSVLFAIINGCGASSAADAFVSGMKKVMIAGLLIGMATAVEIVLTEGQILDTLIHHLAALSQDHSAWICAIGMFIAQLLLDIAIPSTSGQAAVTMPILGPIGQLSGVSGQTTVLAFLMGNGLTNMITPTSSGLLIFLAAAQVGWSEWARFIWPLIAVFFVLSIVLLGYAVVTGY